MIDAVAKTLNMTTPEEVSQLGHVIFPALVNSAVIANNLPKIEQYQCYGANLAAINYDGRTALHIAAREGHYDIVNYLLSFGVPVHVRDKNNRTALMEAVSSNRCDIIKILVKCGAYLTGEPSSIGNFLCHAATKDNVKNLESFRLAGASLELQDQHGRTPLHVVSSK